MLTNMSARRQRGSPSGHYVVGVTTSPNAHPQPKRFKRGGGLQAWMDAMAHAQQEEVSSRVSLLSYSVVGTSDYLDLGI